MNITLLEPASLPYEFPTFLNYSRVVVQMCRWEEVVYYISHLASCILFREVQSLCKILNKCILLGSKENPY